MQVDQTKNKTKQNKKQNILHREFVLRGDIQSHTDS